jgi:hypothetical protein
MDNNGAKKMEFGKDDLVCGNCLFCKELIIMEQGVPHPNTGICQNGPPQIVVLMQMEKTNVINMKSPQMQGTVMSIPRALFPARGFTESACGEYIHKVRLTGYLYEYELTNTRAKGKVVGAQSFVKSEEEK